VLIFFSSPQEARSFFAKRRSTIEKGVKQPSQLKYLDYFTRILSDAVELRSIQYIITTISWTTVKEEPIWIEVSGGGTE
jgi:hypothetical protein